MGYSTAMSVGAYSVVLAESLAAVGLSTLIPAAFVASARALKAASDPQALVVDKPPAQGIMDKHKLGKLLPAGAVPDVIGHIVRDAESLHLLVPKKADVKAEFEMQAGESYAMDGEAGFGMEVVGIHAGFSALYATKSQCKVALDLHYEVAHFLLRKPEDA